MRAMEWVFPFVWLCTHGPYRFDLWVELSRMRRFDFFEGLVGKPLALRSHLTPRLEMPFWQNVELCLGH